MAPNDEIFAASPVASPSCGHLISPWPAAMVPQVGTFSDSTYASGKVRRLQLVLPSALPV